jgi:NADH dehydrogenase [ubiquinone] 1 alpha subcomplex assembly factor 5
MHRDRAAATVDRIAPILDHMADLLLDRLDDALPRFQTALDIGGRGFIAPRLRARGIETFSCDLSQPMACRNPGTVIVADEEFLPFGPDSFDLIVANMSLHWVNDLPGVLIQMRRAMRPGGLLLASMPVTGTLGELREALMEAEMAMTGGLSPRLSPLPDLRDLAGLLQRAGFSLPVADVQPITLSYRNKLQILHDLRDAGETNATRARNRVFPPAPLFPAAFSLLNSFQEQTVVTIHMGILTGWSSVSQ